MPVEIEAKIAIGDPESIRNQLKQLNAERRGEVMEVNTFFDTPEGGLRSTDQGLRVRATYGRNGQAGQRNFTITHKGPRAHGQLKNRFETEVKVDSTQTASRLLTALGFERKLSFEKSRETWELDGCEIALDRLPYLGHFIEIEGPSDEIVLNVRAKLGLADAPLVSAPYIALLVAHMTERKIASECVTLEGNGEG